MAAISITPANVVAGANATRDSGTAGEAITAGQTVYLSSTTNRWMLADTNSPTAEARVAKGIALNGAAANQPVAVLKDGDLTIGATLTKGVGYYLGGAPGSIVPVADLTTGDYTCFLGIAKSTSVLAVKIQSAGVAL
ncbi:MULTISPECIES: hypothetical protein [unclassified Rhizobium]|uniref:hypothetical protein n=1 Tax=unclassified Rhizobium TaxID=2613769 RepID=UPI001ADCADFF|nr:MULTISPECIES: hypothetical protein [unclassified Rhizobium]MBO9124855.1 hypothetical protein [Rhizobium sp. 16-488-2b]MBO9175439.1 hypothetical protein [Rhizobium sp. 16-488-2a]